MMRAGRMRRRRYSYGSIWAPYVPVAERRREAARLAATRRKDGRALSPVLPAAKGRGMAQTFWGRSWCENLERYSDYSNRLPRGRSYLRNGSVIDLQVVAGKVKALVSGSRIYTVEIGIEKLAAKTWRSLCDDCSSEVASLVELLQGRFSNAVMTRLCGPEVGMFPSPKHITMSCSCPDWATMCKHVAAVMYGIGVRLDEAPGLLFVLRQVDHQQLVAASAEGLAVATNVEQDEALAGADLGEMFGIELEATPAALPPQPAKRRAATKASTPRKEPIRDPWITAQELRERKVPQPVVQAWLRKGLMTHSGERGVYLRTAESEALIEEYLAAR